jgi:hypothetical protein
MQRGSAETIKCLQLPQLCVHCAAVVGSHNLHCVGLRCDQKRTGTLPPQQLGMRAAVRLAAIKKMPGRYQLLCNNRSKSTAVQAGRHAASINSPNRDLPVA